jgi:alpha-glucosidase (family GH31 glycosyl hydrolase)
MNIPVAIKKGQIHPSLNKNIFKGIKYQKNKELYHEIQETINSPKYLILYEMEKIKNELENFEQHCLLTQYLLMTCLTSSLK